MLIALLFATLLVSAIAGDRPCMHARILGASFGAVDVTDKIAHSYNLGTSTFVADSLTFGGPLTKDLKDSRMLTVVYEQCGNIATLLVKEG